MQRSKAAKNAVSAERHGYDGLAAVYRVCNPSVSNIDNGIMPLSLLLGKPINIWSKIRSGVAGFPRPPGLKPASVGDDQRVEEIEIEVASVYALLKDLANRNDGVEVGHTVLEVE